MKRVLFKKKLVSFDNEKAVFVVSRAFSLHPLQTSANYTVVARATLSSNIKGYNSVKYVFKEVVSLLKSVVLLYTRKLGIYGTELLKR